MDGSARPTATTPARAAGGPPPPWARTAFPFQSLWAHVASTPSARAQARLPHRPPQSREAAPSSAHLHPPPAHSPQETGAERQTRGAGRECGVARVSSRATCSEADGVMAAEPCLCPSDGGRQGTPPRAAAAKDEPPPPAPSLAVPGLQRQSMLRPCTQVFLWQPNAPGPPQGPVPPALLWKGGFALAELPGPDLGVPWASVPPPRLPQGPPCAQAQAIKTNFEDKNPIPTLPGGQHGAGRTALHPACCLTLTGSGDPRAFTQPAPPAGTPLPWWPTQPAAAQPPGSLNCQVLTDLSS